MSINIKDFEVTYTIEVSVETPEQAALQVEQILLNPDFRPMFEVKDISDLKVVEIDLESFVVEE